MKKFLMEAPMAEESVKKALRLYENTPNGYIVDADTILADVITDAADNSEETGIGSDLLELWLDGTNTERSVIEAVFYNLTGVEFSSYIARCIEETTRNPEQTEKTEPQTGNENEYVAYEAEVKCASAKMFVGNAMHPFEAFTIIRDTAAKVGITIESFGPVEVRPAYGNLKAMAKAPVNEKEIWSQRDSWFVDPDDGTPAF